MRAALGAVLGAALLGCVSLEREAPLVRTYALSPRAEPAAGGRGALALGRFEISPRFARREFVYRQNDVLYEADFYHVFIAEPAVLLREETERGLRDAGLFAHVAAAALLPEAELRLDASVESLYGDYRRPEAPRAVIEMRVIVRDAAGALRLDRAYAPEVGLKGLERAELVRGWEKGLRDILARLAADLRGLRGDPAATRR